MSNLLTGGLGKIFDKLKKKALISESDFKAAMREVRVALLEADVSLAAVKAYIKLIKERVVGGKVITGVSPGQTIIKIAQDELTKLLGEKQATIDLSGKPPVVIMMIGLQGSGKTTTSGKIAKLFKSKKKIMMASLDVYRPAAQKQLAVLGEQIEVDTLEIIDKQKPTDITKRAIKEATLKQHDVLILDTAGRLQIDDTLMSELEAIKSISRPTEILLVVDAVTGQESINVAKTFHERLNLTGLILTKMDGDARGGAALSMSYITKCPIKFLGSGEKLDNLEEFHPERIAGRILNMGDVISLVERASQVIGEDEVEQITEKAKRGEFDFNDLSKQLKTVGKLGGIASIMKMIPGISNMKLPDAMDDNVVKRHLAIISSMTAKERSKPKLINHKRKQRIASGAGVNISDVNALMKKFQQAHAMIGKMNKMGGLEKMKFNPQDISKMFKK